MARPFNRPLPPPPGIRGCEADRLHWRDEYLQRDRARHKEYMAQYRKTHELEIALKRAAYRAAHREELREKAAEYRRSKRNGS